MKTIKITQKDNKIRFEQSNSEVVRHIQRDKKYSFFEQIKRIFKKDSITIINVNVLIINQF